jgi:hypothetical protein
MKFILFNFLKRNTSAKNRKSLKVLKNISSEDGGYIKTQEYLKGHRI